MINAKKLFSGSLKRKQSVAAVAMERCARPVIEGLEQRQMFSVPNGPYALAASASGGQASLAWHDNATDATGYRVERKTAGGAYQAVATLGTTATSFTDSGASMGAQYTYRVCAYNNGGDSSFSNEVSVLTAVTAAAPSASPAGTTTSTGAWWVVPNGPYGLSTADVSSSQINLSWRDNSDNESGFRVERRTASGAYAVIATLPAASTGYGDTTVQPSTTYAYRVCAFNAKGDSSYTNESWVTSLAVGAVSAAGGGSTWVSSGGGTTATATGSAAGFFPVGVFYQPASSFDKWKSRGVNTLYGYDGTGGVTIPQWDAAAAQRGMEVIRQASANAAADNAVSNLMAWLTPQDEPDMNNMSPSTLSAQYWQLKAVNPNKPVITTYSGGYVLNWQGGETAANYAQYLSSTDWTGADLYPVTGWNLPSKINGVGQLVDRLLAYAPGKKDFAFIETSNQQLSWVPNDRGVTPDEMRGEVWDAVIHGAQGITYFPQQIGNGFSYDATPANVAAEMATQDARLQQYGAALLSQKDPAGAGVTTGGSLEATWRVYGGHTYYFVLNLSANTLTGQAIQLKGVSNNATLSVDGEGRGVQASGTTVTDNFAPYQLHVYVA